MREEVILQRLREFVEERRDDYACQDNVIAASRRYALDEVLEHLEYLEKTN